MYIDAEYESIRDVMAKRGTTAGQNKRLPVVLVSKDRANHLDEVENRMKLVQKWMPLAIGIIGFIAGMRMF